MKGVVCMLISFNCPHCQASLKAGSDFAGKTGGCPKCGKEVKVPEQNTVAQSEHKETAKKKD
jgi:endogenous inhibitor of DNA gyrase (YacG/DUF329 family)